MKSSKLGTASYIAVALMMAAPAVAQQETAPSSWRLFDLGADPSESMDVREQFPDEFERLMTALELYAEENGVFAPGQQLQ